MEKKVILLAWVMLDCVHSAVNWNGNNWAMKCDFPGNDLSSIKIRGEDCGGKCSGTQGCTHFAWTNWQGGTCWLKSGPVSQSDAKESQDSSSVCGVVQSNSGGGDGSGRQIIFLNKCGRDIWISPLTNNQGPPLADGIVRLNNGGQHSYSIPSGGWGGRFWPKSGCDGSGQNCELGQSTSPCPNGGCHPPADTKVEFFFPKTGVQDNVWYDVSLVDGYSLPAEIVPSKQGGSCVPTHCAMSLDACPTNENNVGDLRVFKNGRVTMCLAPCKKWNYPAPYGLGKSENIEPGQHLCCPTPPVSPQECRQGVVVQTQYVKLIHDQCPSAYSYSYDDEAGLHNCPNDSSFTVTFCP